MVSIVRAEAVRHLVTQNGGRQILNSGLHVDTVAEPLCGCCGGQPPPITCFNDFCGVGTIPANFNVGVDLAGFTGGGLPPCLCGDLNASYLDLLGLQCYRFNDYVCTGEQPGSIYGYRLELWLNALPAVNPTTLEIYVQFSYFFGLTITRWRLQTPIPVDCGAFDYQVPVEVSLGVCTTTAPARVYFVYPPASASVGAMAAPPDCDPPLRRGKPIIPKGRRKG